MDAPTGSSQWMGEVFMRTAAKRVAGEVPARRYLSAALQRSRAAFSDGIKRQQRLAALLVAIGCDAISSLPSGHTSSRTWGRHNHALLAQYQVTGSRRARPRPALMAAWTNLHAVTPSA